MNKQEFLNCLAKALSVLPEKDIEERLSFYGEMIDDRIEEGLSEEEAVQAIGSVKDIASQIIADTPLTKIAKQRLKPKANLRWWEILLIILGSPVWVSVLIAILSVIFSVYVSLWSVIISLWAVFVSLLASGVGLTAASFIFAFCDKILTGFATFGVGLVCVGLSIFMFFCSKAATKGILILTKKLALGIKNYFVRRGE